MENFIYEGYLEDISICDRLIDYFKHTQKNPGAIGSDHRVDKHIKDSTDAILEGYILHEYLDALQKVTNCYIKKFPWCNFYSPWGVTEKLQIQHYAPGQGYHGWHSERTSASYPNATRHLVFMTYLNDITDQGGTEFAHQGLITTPAKGKTLIWPVDWTYTHRGIASPTQDKYIVTGWYSFV